MKAKVNIKSVSGEIDVIPSKSVAHRLLICAALADEPTEIVCPAASMDIEATARCLSSLGATIEQKDGVYKVYPIKKKEDGELFCGESGSTLRFLIPVAAALGGETVFTGEGKLPERPCMPLVECMKKCGAKIDYDGKLPLVTHGGLCGGKFSIPGNVSSQFITGLIFALPLLEGDSVIEITGKIESLPYINITLETVAEFGIKAEFCENKIKICGNQKYISPKRTEVEGDWSNASFWACLGAITEEGITLRGVRRNSCQGDKKVIEILKRFGAEVEQGEDYVTVRKKNLTAVRIDVSEVPDLVPPLAVVAAVANGETRFVNAARLRIKESDRIESTVAMLKGLGADAETSASEIRVFGKKALSGGKVNSYNDHRIAMSAAIAAAVSDREVTIRGAEAVRKSYGDFFEKLSSLGAEVVKTEG